MSGQPITFVDVETTGLSRDDRVVSIGVIHLPDADMLRDGAHEASATHLIFNPGRPSDPRARKVHGYSDQILSIQDPFEQHAKDLLPFFDHGGIIVAHNASFDRRFVAAEFKAAGVRFADPDYFCTMLAHRRKYGSRSGLDAVLSQMGLGARDERHGALQDAWCAMQVYNWLHDGRELAPVDLFDIPLNYRASGDDTRVAAAVAPAPIVNPALALALEHMAPMATLMLSIARADSDFSMMEVDAISTFINARLDLLKLRLTGDEFVELLSSLCGLDTDGGAVRAACRAVSRSGVDTDELAWWIRQITFADGSGSVPEQRVIGAITQYMREEKRG